MTAPRRWKDAPDAPIGVRELLASARPRAALGERAFERGARRVARLGVAPAAVAVTAIWVKLAAAGAVALATAGAVVAYEVEHREPSGTPSTVSEGARIAVVAPLPSVKPGPTTEPAPPPMDEPPLLAPLAQPPRPVAPGRASIAPDSPFAPPSASASLAAPSPSEPPSPPAASTLADELALLEHARKSVARDPESALRGVAAHRARYPHGVLSAERDLVELDALRHGGRKDEARARARAWLERDPAGLHSARVRAILASLD